MNSQWSSAIEELMRSKDLDPDDERDDPDYDLNDYCQDHGMQERSFG